MSTEQYSQGKELAPRPRNGVLDLSRLESTGYRPGDATDALRAYLSTLSTVHTH